MGSSLTRLTDAAECLLALRGRAEMAGVAADAAASVAGAAAVFLRDPREGVVVAGRTAAGPLVLPLHPDWVRLATEPGAAMPRLEALLGGPVAVVPVPGRTAPAGALVARAGGHGDWLATLAAQLGLALASLPEDAHYDALTGIPDRAGFDDAVAAALARGGGHNGGIAVAVIDLDDFRRVNETMGHATGDLILTEVALRLGAAATGPHSLARLAADEFAVLLEGVPSAGAAREAIDHLLDAAQRPFDVAGRAFRISASAGVARSESGAMTPTALIRRAEIALTRAQQRGGGGVEVFTPEMDARQAERNELESELGVAISRNELELHFQPIVDLHTSRWCGAEALVRWQHPDLGRIRPDRFIGIAEESQLILEIGEWVLQEACLRLADWRAAGLVPDDFRVAVNVSGVQLLHGDLPAAVRKAAAAARLPLPNLTLEVTETALAGPGEARPVLETLAAGGSWIALDDFGTGYSSLSYLKELPAHVLKIPRPFVRALGGDGVDGALVAGIVALARSLGLQPLAEGVETPHQHAGLLAAGCGLGQGYLFSPPLPGAGFAEQLASGKAHGESGVGGGDGGQLLARLGG